MPSTGGHAFVPPRWDHGRDEADGQKGGYAPTDYLVIEINFSRLESERFLSRISTFGAAPVQPVGHSPDPFFEIGTIVYPFFLTLGHELIHVLHFLDNPRVFRDNLTSELDITFWSLYGGDSDRSIALWKNLEEQITVIGTPAGVRGEEISEASLLVEFEITPRYAYQPSDRPFYEYPGIIERVFGRFPDCVALRKEEWQFDAVTALTSPLNPADLKRVNEAIYSSAREAARGLVDVGAPATERQEERRRALLERLAARRKPGPQAEKKE
jgi:hypothetical protein